MTFEILHGDCLDAMALCIEDSSIDAIVGDPPYGLSFMGRHWDYDVPSVDIWRECLRVLKPGGHLLAFAGTRTQHRMAVNIEDAGFEIRDMIAWVYGSGFPKSLDVSKAIDKAVGVEREITREAKVVDDYRPEHIDMDPRSSKDRERRDIPATAAAAWQGWGTALKPALEPITVARKPLGNKTVAENVLAFGTGAINVDGCRVGDSKTPNKIYGAGMTSMTGGTESSGFDPNVGRWPANLIHDGSDEVLANFPDSAGQLAKASTSDTQRAGQNCYGTMARGSNGQEPRNDTGSAARFFYCAKASKKDRDEGNAHPTVKPTDLMRYLCRLVTPPGGLILDPFTGSGSTGKAAMLEGFRFIGIEREAEYVAIARARIERAAA